MTDGQSPNMTRPGGDGDDREDGNAAASSRSNRQAPSAPLARGGRGPRRRNDPPRGHGPRPRQRRPVLGRHRERRRLGPVVGASPPESVLTLPGAPIIG